MKQLLKTMIWDTQRLKKWNIGAFSRPLIQNKQRKAYLWHRMINNLHFYKMNDQTFQRSCYRSGVFAVIIWCSLALLLTLAHLLFKLSVVSLNSNGYLVLLTFVVISLGIFVLGYLSKKHYLQEKSVYLKEYPDMDKQVFERLFKTTYRNMQLRILSLFFLGSILLVGVSLTFRPVNLEDIILLSCLSAGGIVTYLIYSKEKNKPSFWLYFFSLCILLIFL